LRYYAIFATDAPAAAFARDAMTLIISLYRLFVDAAMRITMMICSFDAYLMAVLMPFIFAVPLLAMPLIAI